MLVRVSLVPKPDRTLSSENIFAFIKCLSEGGAPK